VQCSAPSTARRSAADPKTVLKAFLPPIPLDLFALLRLRSTGGMYLNDIRPVSP